MAYPKWKYSKDADGFRSTLVADAATEAQLGPAWTDNPHEHGVEVVPYPAELTVFGVVVHHPMTPDANGNHPYGPPPTTIGSMGATLARR